MEFPFTVISRSENQTMETAKEFSKILKEGDTVFLNGELGSGKTFFVRSACVELGINNVSSPSFSIINEYIGIKKVRHFDFYRIKKASELINIGFHDFLSDDAVSFIEWSDLFPELLPKRNYRVDFKFVNETTRKLDFSKDE